MPTTAWLRYIPAVRGPQLEEVIVAPPPVATVRAVEPPRGQLLLAKRPGPAIQLVRVPAARPHRRH